MAEQEKDRLAAALAAMSGGEAAPNEVQQNQAQVNTPASTEGKTPVGTKKVDGTQETPGAAHQTHREQPVPRPQRPAPTPPPSARPARPRRAMPTPLPGSSAVARPARPEAFVSGQDASRDDDEAVIVPPPPIEYLGHAPAHHRHASARLEQAMQSLQFRRTVIPLLLTCGGLLILMGIGVFLVPAHSPFAVLRQADNRWMPLAMFALAVVMLALAALNMLHVRQQLQAAKRQT